MLTPTSLFPPECRPHRKPSGCFPGTLPPRQTRGKRPFQTIIPAFVTQNGRPVMSFGVMGGLIQAQAHTQVMVRLADYHQNPQAASHAPRWRLDEGLTVNIEHGVGSDVVAELRHRGHHLVQADRTATEFGRGQFIYKLDEGYFAASEKRTDGQAVGF